jgi:hypothetical protein
LAVNLNPKVVHIDKPFKIQDLPLQDIYVLDDWLSVDLFHHYANVHLRTYSEWSKTNEVQSGSATGFPHHSFWGATYFRGAFEEDGSLGKGNLVPERGSDPLNAMFARYIDSRLRTEFGFKWEKFQYMGLNSQTQGLDGTTHSDCAQDEDWNISFLYYCSPVWYPSWGGDLRIYDTMQFGLDGRADHVKNHQVASVEYKPNRLLMFDGRIPHGADAPTTKARYMDRRSIVLRGDEVSLTHEGEEYHANDRISQLQLRDPR